MGLLLGTAPAFGPQEASTQSPAAQQQSVPKAQERFSTELGLVLTSSTLENVTGDHSDNKVSAKPLDASGSDQHPPSSIRQWLLDRKAPELIGRPIHEIEWLFTNVRLRHSGLSLQYLKSDSDWIHGTGPTPQDIHPRYPWLLAVAKDAHPGMSHQNLRTWTDHGIYIWELNAKEGVDLLLALEYIWNPSVWIQKCSEEMERDVFRDWQYWPELRDRLGWPAWTEGELEQWTVEAKLDEYYQSDRLLRQATASFDQARAEGKLPPRSTDYNRIWARFCG